MEAGRESSLPSSVGEGNRGLDGSVTCSWGAASRALSRARRGFSAWMPAAWFQARRFALPPDTRIVGKLPRSRSKARASPPFEERAASHDQRRPFSHHMQPQAPRRPRRRWHRPRGQGSLQSRPKNACEHVTSRDYAPCRPTSLPSRPRNTCAHVTSGAHRHLGSRPQARARLPRR